jgi:hypothetical protein
MFFKCKLKTLGECVPYLKEVAFGCLTIGFMMIALSGCASINPSYGIISFGQTATSSRDAIDGNITTETFVVIPIGSSFSSDDDMGLKIGRIKKNGTIIDYYFRAEVHSTSWIFAKGISVKIDDIIYNLNDSNPDRHVQSGQYVIEILTFSITPEMLEQLKNANTFSAELHRRVETLTSENLEKVKAFIQ